MSIKGTPEKFAEINSLKIIYQNKKIIKSQTL